MTAETPIANAARPAPQPRGAYRHFSSISTRWMDNDVYGHINNVVYYSYFDTVINRYLIDKGGLDIHTAPVIGIAVESQCKFSRSLAFPQEIDAGLRIGHLGNSSVRYEVGLFARGANEAAASGHFVHVFVGRTSQRPVPIPPAIRAALEKIKL